MRFLIAVSIALIAAILTQLWRLRNSTVDTESSASAVDKPNIIMFIIDDLGWNDTGYQGADFTTPSIDRLAQEGVRLKQYYVQPLCTPSRASLMAGRYSYSLGLARQVITNGHPFGLGLQETTFVQRLKDGGYATHAVGKWNLGMHKWEYTPTYRGFDTFFGYYDADEDYYTHKSERAYPNPRNPSETIRAIGVDFRNNKEAVTDEGGSYNTNLFTQAIQEAIVNHDPEKGPFFVYGAFQSIHGPLEVPMEYLEKCAKVPYANRKIICGMMQALDEGIGNITTTLTSKGYLDNTTIIFTTDNGGQTSHGSSNWPLRGNKATVFEGGVRGFSFVWGKKLLKTNYDNSGLMHITDWYRTIVEGIAGLKMSDNDTKGLDGQNMWPTIINDSPSSRTEILLQLDPPSYVDRDNPFIGQAAYRSGDWKLILGKPDCNSSWEIACPTGWVNTNGTIDPAPDNPSGVWLFNIAEDPNERNNMAGTFQDIVALMEERIEAFNSTLVEPPFDPRADPKNFKGVWTPWLT